jgi:LL-diaminopimelate aminotransferase
MIWANGNFQLLQDNYLFSTIARKVREYQAANPGADIIRLGIGDVTLPLPEAVLKAMHVAVDEMGKSETFKGYSPDGGYDFLRKAISDNDYKPLGANIDVDEIFISDGAKNDTANFTNVFDSGNVIAITDPVYPVYLDSNIIAGNGGKVQPDGKYTRIKLLPCTADTGFMPELPRHKVDVIYLCSPNNPTGTVMNRDELKKWVDYARRHGSLILFDSAYEAYIQDDRLPRSIYEIDGAKEVAVEFRSYSKTAGFTGVRCSYTVIPRDIKTRVKEGGTASLNKLWARRQDTMFNGVPYIIQRGAEAIYTPAGQAQIKKNIDYYMQNAKDIRKCFESLGQLVFGGENGPYIWLQIPEGYTSWQYFDHLLVDFNIVGTPGSGFGSCGEGYFRLTGFGSRENTLKAIERLKNGRK